MNCNSLKKIILSFCTFISLGAYAQTTIVDWDFPGNPDNATADGGVAANAAKTISTVGGTSGLDFSNNGATTRSAEATTWTTGSGVKYWQVDFVTTGFTSILVSSAQRSDNNGPRDFQLEYKLSAGGTWSVVTTVPTVANNWTAGVLNNVALPANANNQATVFLRWIMTSNTRVSGGNVTNAGYNRIDDIVIEGTCAPATPACATYSLPTNGASVCTSGQTLSWGAIATPTCGTIVYDVYFNAGTTATTLAANGQAGTTYPTGALINGTTYAWRIVPRNGAATATGCATFTFVANTPTPGCATLNSPANSSSVCPVSQTLSWTALAATGCGTIVYDVYFNAGATATTLVSNGQAGTTYATGALTSGTAYAWRIVPRNGTVTATGCTNNVFTASTGANDLPCNATIISLGTVASGDNSCAGSTGEPAANPSCWTTGNRNTVWYSFIAPATGNVKIRTAPGTLLNTQIAVYTGACGTGMTIITAGCNRDAPNCGSTPVLLSELSLTGLINGATYYVAVDGENSLVGTFAITVIEASTTYPSSSGQSCLASIIACNTNMGVGNPGYQGIGFSCDNDGTGNCTTGERGSAWYTINIANAGNLNFNIVPNDYNAASPGAETDYDFVLWKVSGTGSVSCTNISSGSAPVACNYDGYGVTGVAPGGNAPAPYNAAFNGAYEPSIAVVSGDSYLLMINNFSNSISGFNLDLSGNAAGVINYIPPTNISWTGAANNDSWTSATNWGGCLTPTCGINTNITPGSSVQPLITAAMGTVSVNNLSIDPGGILKLGPNAVLKICGNFINNGSISADATSTILFSDNLTHTISGSYIGTNKIGNLTITGGSNCTVVMADHIGLKGNFTTTNTNSIFNLNGKNFSIEGDFMNAAGATTFLNASGSTFTFDGINAQTYNPNALSASPTLTLNSVTLNHTGTGVTLSTTNTPNMVLGTSGVLTLTAGKIITPNNQEVTIMNTSPAAVSAGNTTSYVEGKLRRYLAAGATGLFEFPVGHATPGYERATINFKTAAATGAIQLVARFDPWGGTFPMPAIPNWTECSTTYDLNYLNHGYWSIDASSASTGLYDLTLYNRSYSNASGSGYSIAKSPSAAPSWALNGNCAATPAASVQRNSMSGFSKMATIQGGTPLPVQLISFTGTSEGTYNSVNWKSAVETNFRHYELETSEEGMNFNKITSVNPIGNLSSTNNYNYLDFSPYSPITYYRLKMIDLDYSFEYSPIIAIENGSNKTGSIVVFPNPASNELYIKLSVANENNAMVDIKDILGRTIYKQAIDLTQTIDNTYINTTDFAAGTYIVNITAGNSLSENIKVVINKN
jgi:hypothetical protein